MHENVSPNISILIETFHDRRWKNIVFCDVFFLLSRGDGKLIRNFGFRWKLGSCSEHKHGSRSRSHWYTKLACVREANDRYLWSATHWNFRWKENIKNSHFTYFFLIISPLFAVWSGSETVRAALCSLISVSVCCVHLHVVRWMLHLSDVMYFHKLRSERKCQIHEPKKKESLNFSL